MTRSDAVHPSRDVKACYACASAKRRCTKRLPKCQRCEARNLSCVYEARPRFIVYQDQRQALHQSYDYAATEDSYLDEGAVQLMPTPAHSPNWWPRSISPVDASLDDLRSAWFLTPETWNIVPLNVHALTPVNKPLLQGYICKAQTWLREWAATGSNPFIHSELYTKTMPTCVQDAYMVLAMYLSRTEKNCDMVLRLVQSRVAAFISSEKARKPGNLLDEVGRVHALLVYSIIRLFDGDIRQRHLAEEHLPTLVLWAEAMRERATNENATGNSLLDNPLNHHVPDLQDSSQRRNHKSAEELLWNAWILSESVRRTWYICLLVVNGYRLLKTGAVVCRGSIPITTRAGVWQAKTANSWLRTCAEKNVGFANRNETEALMRASKAEEVDRFTLALMEVDFGSERIEGWKRT
ncbi:fungal zn(2)-Cys(6) binuclear cluster domain-containing protein [Sarocladium implicatum]|nr:fungal zn(2)-Cys(6) binuclear cluster domain-containing protein [Sarocladium implicatum]